MPAKQSPVSPALPNASRGKRFASMMYEGVLLFAVVFIADYLFDALTQSRHGLMLRFERQVWLFLAIGFYFVICLRAGGQTLPMKAWHIKLIGPKGTRPSVIRLTLRYIASWIIPMIGMAALHFIVMSVGWKAIYLFAIGTPFLIFIPTWFRRDGRFLHDLWCKTRIVDIRTLQNK